MRDLVDSYRHVDDAINTADVNGLDIALAKIPGKEILPVVGTGTYIVPPNIELERIRIKTASDLNIKVGTTEGGGELMNEVVPVNTPRLLILNYELENSFTIYITGNCTAKIFTR